MSRTADVWLVEPGEAAAKAVRNALARQDADPNVRVIALESGALPHGLPDIGAGPQVVLLDLWVADEPWGAVLRDLRERPATRDAAMVVLGPADDDWAVLRCHQLGADAFLTKPHDAVALAAAVREVAAYWLGVRRGDGADVEPSLG